MRRRDWATWLFALVIAVVLWYYVVAQGNLTQTLQVPVEVTGVSEKMIARALPASVSVTVTGPRETVDGITVDNVRVRAVLASPDPGNYRTPLRVTVPRGVSARVAPELARVRVEQRPAAGPEARVRSRAVPIALATRGQPAPGYRVDNIEFAPTIATVTGIAERVSSLRAVPTDALNLEGARNNVEARLPLLPPPGVAVLSPATVYVVVYIRPGPLPVHPVPPEESP
ncbi:hypothetical protein AMK68_00440 [candidate division KD3-62 bacterium DG_56]|uniref:YbbR-like domain-containing protein n=1 Tax=candidate division KD3-62 bacterium DG_56 TaxID=1704032 RepID=A0A0S7XRY0_9BACT|nr:MAG: hypothetical protein AMK68_00440 [candidate division KD3-62 bacterium DG_56]